MARKDTDTGWREMTKTQELIHQQTILVEGLRSDFKFVIEKVDGQEANLNRRIDELRKETRQEFDDIKGILKYHSSLLNQNEERWNQNEARWNQNEERWNQNDVRLERIEGKLDQVADKVERHDREIKELKAAS